MINWIKNIGPASLVAAAFIGPGTVTVCTLAGYNHGYDLLWALLFSVLATIILQEMAARIGIVSGQGLGEALRSQLTSTVGKIFSIVLVLSAIVVGNAAYEAGNLSGAVLGLDYFISGQYWSLWPLIIGSIAFIFLFIGSYKVLEKLLVSLVIIMSICFVLTAIMTLPSVTAILRGLFIPKVSESNLIGIIGLIGTTVVPYNLFLHASLVNEKWHGKSIAAVRKDTIISIGLGGIISMAIVVCAAAVQQAEVNSARDLAIGLEPLLGRYAGLAIAIGLFAAGITSAITAPLAAAYAASGILGWKKSMKSLKFRSVWMCILILGMIFSSLGIRPVQVIQFAQVANGLLLPLIAGFVLWIVNRSAVMGDATNKVWQNIAGIIVLILTVVLGAKSIWSML